MQNETEELASGYMNEGIQTFHNNQLEQAAVLVQKSVHLFKETDNKKMYAKSLNMMGVIYGAIGNEGAAIDYYLEGLECAINHHCDSNLPLFYNNI